MFPQNKYHKLFLEKKKIPPTVKQKLMSKYPDISIDWEKVYSLAFIPSTENLKSENFNIRS